MSTTGPLHGQRVDDRTVRRPGSCAIAGALLGLGVVAFLDETVFHQILHWHHFYDRGTSAAGLVSDGLFHAFSWFATVGGLLLLVRLRRAGSLHGLALTAGLLCGAGAFQLYDGLLQHKVFGLHQIRYDVDLVPYDVTWNVIAGALLVAGLLLLLRVHRSTARRR